MRPVSLVLVHAAATLFMTGLIWFVQVVHYPLMAEVGPDRFLVFAELHNARTAWVVMPVMLIELVTALLLIRFRPAPVSRRRVLLGLILLAGIWFSTFLVQVPRHTALLTGFDADIHRSLVLTNWIRAVLWSVRAGLVLSMVSCVMKDEVSHA